MTTTTIVITKESIVNWNHVISFIIINNTVYMHATDKDYPLKQFDSKSSAESFVINTIPKLLTTSQTSNNNNSVSIIDLRKI
jgi:hypothetical protein